MPLNIKSEKAHEMAKELAQLTGTSITDAVSLAVERALVEARARKNRRFERAVKELNEIAAHCAALPVRDHRTADEILGYDERGMP